MSEPWATLRLVFSVDGDDTYRVAVDLYEGDSVLDAIERAGVGLVNSFAKDVANRLAFAKASKSMNGSIVDSTVGRLNGVTS